MKSSQQSWVQMLPLTRLLASAGTLFRFLALLQSDFSSLGAVRYPGFISVGVACRALEPCGILEERTNQWRSAGGVHLRSRHHYRPTGGVGVTWTVSHLPGPGTANPPQHGREILCDNRIGTIDAVDSVWCPLSPDHCLTGLYVSNSANLGEYKRRRRREDIRAHARTGFECGAFGSPALPHSGKNSDILVFLLSFMCVHFLHRL